MREWRIYYADATTFSDAEGSYLAAPSLGVQAISYQDRTDGAGNVGRRTVSGKDYYWFEDGHWWGGDLFGLFDFLIRSGLVKFGRSIDDGAFATIHQRAIDDPDFPPKSAYHPTEWNPHGASTPGE